MKKNAYVGRTFDDVCVLTFATGDTVVDLFALATKHALHWDGRIRWGDQSEASRYIAMVILWHACGDYDCADNLSTLFVHDVVQHFGKQWELERDWVRDWLVDHQRFRPLQFRYPFAWLGPCQN